MCGGASGDEQEIEGSQLDFMKQLQSEATAEYGKEQGILDQMTSTYAPILAAGPNQTGFSDAENTSLNTEATEGVAQTYAQGSKALKEAQASEGGGDNYLPSGVQAQQQGDLIAKAAGEESSEKQQIVQANYGQGYQKFRDATAALGGVASAENPNGTESNANTAGTSASATAGRINSESSSWLAPVLGAVGSVGGAAAGAAIMA